MERLITTNVLHIGRGEVVEGVERKGDVLLRKPNESMRLTSIVPSHVNKNAFESRASVHDPTSSSVSTTCRRAATLRKPSGSEKEIAEM